MTDSVVQRLRRAAGALPAGPVSMQALAHAHGPAANGTLLLLMAVPCVLPVPGVGTVLGVGMAAMGVAMWRGHGCIDLPQRVGQLEISGRWAQRVLGLLGSTYAVAGRFAKARLSHLASPDKRSWTAAAIGLMALIIMLPIPFGNLLPAVALVLIGLGLVFRDGLAVILGLVTAGIATSVTVGLLVMAWSWGSDWMVSWF